MDPSTSNSCGLSRSQRAVKRLFDLVVAAGGLVILSPIIVLAWVVASLETRANGLFRQLRVGRNAAQFHTVKIRTMRTGRSGSTVTVRGDSRITRSGTVFRRLKIDELPQLWNVIVGEMSLVGPRPDVPGFADRLSGEDRLLLSVRPGITGPATLKYRDEEEILRRVENPEEYNRAVIFPDKVLINVDYVRNYSFVTDLKIIWQTVTGA